MDNISDDGYSYEFSKIYKNPNYTLNYRDLCLKFGKNGDVILFCLHQIFRDERFQGRRLLDIGCGPTVFRAALASKFISEIILSDYSEHHLEEIQKWVKNEPCSKYWDVLFKPQAIFEGFSQNMEEGIDIIKSRTRGKITRILPCDILKKEIVPVDVGKFDIVLSIFCICAACSTIEAFKSAIKKIRNYLLPDGELVLGVVLDCSFYIVNNIEGKIPRLSISQQMVNEILEEAGFKKKHCFVIENHLSLSFGEIGGYLILSATMK